MTTPGAEGDERTLHAYRFHALGCTVRIRLANVDTSRAERFAIAAVGWLRSFAARLTRFDDGSLVGRLNAGAGCEGVRPDDDLLAVLDAAERAWRVSDGRLDATSLPLQRCWHDPRRTAWPTPAELAQARALVDWCSVERSPELVRLSRSEMAVDLGGVGKEWAADRLVALAGEAGIADCLVELGGDCAARGGQPGHAGWWVALPGGGALELRDAALATSGIGTRRRLLAGREVAHLIDARSGLPACGAIRSATVLADTCLEAGIRASDCCLLQSTDSAAIAKRCAGLPMWCRLADGSLRADPRLLARVRPLAQGARAA